MRYAAGLLVLGLAGGVSGCVDRVIVEQASAGSGSDSASSSTTEGSSDESTTEVPWTTDGPECNGPDDCGPDATCFEGICVGTGELRISLSWNYISDLDLHVRTPAGTHISFENPNAGGGILDVDDCVGGQCVSNASTHVENIYFPNAPAQGQYRVWVRNYDGIRGGPFTIHISGAASHSFTGELPAIAVDSQVFTFDL